LSNKQDVCVSIGGHGCPSNAGEKNPLNPNYWGFTLNLTPFREHLQSKKATPLAGCRFHNNQNSLLELI
jgi:hypothetical protein